MGYGIVPYVVRLGRLRAAVRSHDERVVSGVRRLARVGLEELEADFADEIARGAPHPAIALRDLVVGRPVATRASAFMYVYALEVLCAHFGERLDSGPFERVGPALLRALSRVLARGGVDAFSLDDLIDGRPPIALPRWKGFPRVGTIEPAAVAPARRQLDAMLREPRAVGARRDEHAARDGLLTLASWFASARRVRGGGLVCFYY